MDNIILFGLLSTNMLMSTSLFYVKSQSFSLYTMYLVIQLRITMNIEHTTVTVVLKGDQKKFNTDIPISDYVTTPKTRFSEHTIGI